MPGVSNDTISAFIDLEWPKAITHSGMPESELSLWKAEKTSAELKGVAAQAFGPHQNPDQPYAFSEQQFKEATSPEMRERHRIVMHLDYEYPDGLSPDALQALIGALLRHELEHAKQAERWGPDLFNIYDQFVLPAMSRACGGSIPFAYINLAPIELDANAASADYLRDHHAQQLECILETNNGNLARPAESAQPIDTLMSRMTAFLYLFRQQAEALARPLPVASYLKVYDAEAASTWAMLAEELPPRHPDSPSE